MITKEEFEKLIKDYQKWSNRVEEVSKVLDTPNLFECDIVEYAALLFDKTLNFLFKEEGVDFINCWLFEELQIIDPDGKVTSIDTVDDLWNLVEEYQK